MLYICYVGVTTSVPTADASTSTNVTTASMVAAVISNLSETSSCVVNSAQNDLTTALSTSPVENMEKFGNSPVSAVTQTSSGHLVGVNSSASLASSW